jgi:flagellar protein FliO/FliZ
MNQLIGILLPGVFMSSVTWSQTTVGGKTDSGISYLGGAWFGLVSLALLVLLFALIWWFYKTYGQNRSAGPVQILATQALGPRERILIVRIEDRILALGQTPQQISLLTELDSFTHADPTASQRDNAFSAVLGKIMVRARS